MSFSIQIDKEEQEQFLKVMALYPGYMYVNGEPSEDKYNLMFLGEDMERDCLLQEALMEHLDSVVIEEDIRGQ
jgi:hypothetical protein